MKKQDIRSMLYAGCALGIAMGYAALAPLGCGSASCGDATDGADCPPGPGTGGAAGTGGVGGGSAGGIPDTTGLECGGIASLTCPEPESTFCNFPGKPACGHEDSMGLCEPRPIECTTDCLGVCGCDGKFYCNACEAHRAGTDDIPMGTCGDGT